MTWSCAYFSRERAGTFLLVAALVATGGCAPAGGTDEADPADPADPATVVERALEGPDDVLAVVGGEPIRLSDVSTDVAMQVWRRQVDIHALLQREVERRVEARLVEREAERRGVSAEALVEGEIEARVQPVVDADLDAWFEEHPQDAGRGESGRQRVALFLNETRRQDARLAFLKALREAAGVEIRLAPPPRPRIDVPVEGAPERGAGEGALTLVHFGVPSDDASAEVAEWIRALEARHPGRLREVVRPVLGGRDEVGLTAALVGYVAQDAGVYWDWYDRVVAEAGAVDREALMQAAVEAGVPRERLEAALAGDAGLRRLRADIGTARSVGVETPPVVFVEGDYFSASFGREAFEARVEAALRRQEAKGVSL